MRRCKYGHDLTQPENVYHHAGRTRCRPCKIMGATRRHQPKPERPPTISPEKFRSWAEQTWATLDERTRDAIRAL